MSQTLVPGQNCPVPAGVLSVVIKSGAPADFSSFRLFADGKTRKDEDFIFYGQKVNDDKTISLSHDACSATFSVDTMRLDSAVAKVVFAVTSDFPTISRLNPLSLEIFQAGTPLLTCQINTAQHDEAALILGELYRRNGQWKFRFVAQGFREGLRPLAEYYGVDIADDTPAPPSPTPAPAPAPTVRLSKIVLTKAAPRIDLSKHSMARGLFRVNLNWNHTPKASKNSGILQQIFGSKGIDLDLAAYVRLRNGQQIIIQALDRRFGALDQPPYVKLLGDDRTGSQAEGEWLHINGDHIDELEEVLVFAFIYDGVPNWRATDAVVRLEIAGHPEIETRLSEGDDRLPMCAIARILNTGNSLRVERIERYFDGHQAMDMAFGWGFRWKAGKK